jgi:DNA-binding NarL/FixJ family response regulator
MVRVLLVNQIRLLGHLIAAALEDAPDIEVVGCATSVREALVLAPEADVVLVDVRMPDDAALRLIRCLAATGLSTKVLALGLAESNEQILHYVQAGAVGYVLKDDSVHDMLSRIRDAYTGTVRVSPTIAAALMSRVADYAQVLDGANVRVGGAGDLTPREIEILEMISQGFTNRQIADRLVLEVGTIKNHVHRILQKLDANSRHEAAATWAILKATTSVQGTSIGSILNAGH